MAITSLRTQCRSSGRLTRDGMRQGATAPSRDRLGGRCIPRLRNALPEAAMQDLRLDGQRGIVQLMADDVHDGVVSLVRLKGHVLTLLRQLSIPDSECVAAFLHKLI